MKAVYIKSYAHAESLGIKPFDSLISTVAIPSKKPKIVAFRGSHGFSAKDKGKYTTGRTVQYTDGSERFYATNSRMLDILLKAIFRRKPRIYRVSMTRVR